MRDAGVFLASVLLLGSVVEATYAGLEVDVTPAPPLELANPGGSLTIIWEAEFEDPPERVEFVLFDPTRTIVIDRETYSGSDGTSRSRSWTVPEGMSRGKYWVRVEYWSLACGMTAAGEVAFLVGEPVAPGGLEDPTPPSWPTTWGRVKTRQLP